VRLFISRATPVNTNAVTASVIAVESTTTASRLDAFAAQSVEVLHDADARRHEQQRQVVQQGINGCAEFGRKRCLRSISAASRIMPTTDPAPAALAPARARAATRSTTSLSMSSARAAVGPAAPIAGRTLGPVNCRMQIDGLVCNATNSLGHYANLIGSATAIHLWERWWPVHTVAGAKS